MLLHAPNGDKKIYWKGGAKKSSPDVIRGLSIGSVYLAEVNLIHPEMLAELARRTYAAADRYFIADLNPDSPEAYVYKEFFPRFEKSGNLYWLHWICKDNPILTPERLHEIEQECKVSPFIYKRDWLGLRGMPEGTVYFMFDPEKHILDELPEDVTKVKMYFAGDGGVTDATSIGCYIVCKRNGKYLLYRVGGWYYDRGEKAFSTQAREIAREFIPYMREKYGMREQGIFIDPACKSLRLELQKEGLQGVQNADNNSHDIRGTTKGIRCGIEMAQNALTDGLIHFVEDDKFGTAPVRKEFSLYCFDDKGEPIDKYNHFCDEFRYSCSHFLKNFGYWYGTPRARTGTL